MQLLLQIASTKYTPTQPSRMQLNFSRTLYRCAINFIQSTQHLIASSPPSKLPSIQQAGLFFFHYALFNICCTLWRQISVVVFFVDNGKITNVLNTVKVSAMSADPSHNSNVTQKMNFSRHFSYKTKHKRTPHTHTWSCKYFLGQ